MRARTSTAWRSRTCRRATACCSSVRPRWCASCTRLATAISPRCARSCAGAKRRPRSTSAVLRALEIRDYVLIAELSLELDAGFSVLSGETGAGKSILVDAIELLVGGRGDAAMVREGAERAELAAEFDPSEDLVNWLRERDLEGDAGRLLVRRTIDRAGRSRLSIK